MRPAVDIRKGLAIKWLKALQCVARYDVNDPLRDIAEGEERHAWEALRAYDESNRRRLGRKVALAIAPAADSESSNQPDTASNAAPIKGTKRCAQLTLPNMRAKSSR
jgi:hypothetical protein